MKTEERPLKLVLSLFLPFWAAFVGSSFTVTSGWYAALTKPPLNPPNWVFAPVWTLLYFMMGVSLYLAWRRDDEAIRPFSLQLFLNVMWSLLFFGFQSPSLALICIAVLWYAIVRTIRLFFKASELSAYLLLPYLFWVSFAAYLNYGVALLN